MKITLTKIQEQVDLIKAMASRDRNVAYEAQMVFAEYMGRKLSEVMGNAPILANFYTSLSYTAGSAPSIPVDLFADVQDVDFAPVWVQAPGGGLGSHRLVPPQSDMYMDTYTLTSAYHFGRKHAAESRLDVAAKCLEKILEEALHQMETRAVGPIMSALANAQTNGLDHVFRVGTAGRLVPDDFFNLDVRQKRINTSFIRGTPKRGANGVTDLLMSPESMKELKSMAYNPINTAAAPYTSALKDSIPAPDAIREEIWRGAGMQTFFGKSLHEFNEFGIGTDKRFNAVFDVAAGSTSYSDINGSNGAAFDATASELILGIDRSMDGIIRLVETDPEANSEFVMSADDQFSQISRANRYIGFVGEMTEGRAVLNNKQICGLIR